MPFICSPKCFLAFVLVKAEVILLVVQWVLLFSTSEVISCIWPPADQTLPEVHMSSQRYMRHLAWGAMSWGVRFDNSWWDSAHLSLPATISCHSSPSTPLPFQLNTCGSLENSRRSYNVHTLNHEAGQQLFCCQFWKKQTPWSKSPNIIFSQNM